MTYAGINGGCETFRARAEHAFAPNARSGGAFPLGAEGAGVVVAVGPGVGGPIAPGSHVACNGAAAFGEYCVAKAALVTVVDVAGPEAVALVLSGVTACAALEATARIQAGEVVCITAAAGGTGHLALQLAKLAGCVAVAMVGDDHKALVVRGLGADVVVNYRREDVRAVLRRHFPGGLDVVYEGVGGELQRAMLDCLAPAGRLLQVGYISEYPHNTNRQQHPAAAAAAAAAATASAPPSGSRPEPATSSSSSSSNSSSNSSSTSAAIGSRGTVGGGVAASEGQPAPPPGHHHHGAGGEEAGAAAGAGVELPSCEELFWKGLEVQRGQQRIIGQVWPKDIKAIVRCRRRVFDLYRQGRLRVLTDQGHGQHGVEGVAQAVEYMLRGGHVGKVVIKIGHDDQLQS